MYIAGKQHKPLEHSVQKNKGTKDSCRHLFGETHILGMYVDINADKYQRVWRTDRCLRYRPCPRSSAKFVYQQVHRPIRQSILINPSHYFIMPPVLRHHDHWITQRTNFTTPNLLSSNYASNYFARTNTSSEQIWELYVYEGFLVSSLNQHYLLYYMFQFQWDIHWYVLVHLGRINVPTVQVESQNANSISNQL